MNSDPEVGVLAPIALENLDRISTSPLYLAVPCPSSATVHGGFLEELHEFSP